MGRSPCCTKIGLNRGAWNTKEDEILSHYIETHGEGKWSSLPERAGLKRCGKSCRLRWLNYLKPGIKRGSFSPEEEDLILRLHKLLGNRWSLIAGRLPGRTDNEIKNYWNSNLAKRIGAYSSSEPSKRKNCHAKNPTSQATEIPVTIPIRSKARKLIKNLPDLMPSNENYIIKSSQPQNTVEPDIILPHVENDCSGGRDINVEHDDLGWDLLKFTSYDLQACDDGAKGNCIFTNELCLSQEYNSPDVHGEITLDWLSKQMSEDDNINIDLGSLNCFLGHDEL